jgi:hypothetical protein
MKLTEHTRYIYDLGLDDLGDRIDEMRSAQARLAFCLDVYRKYNNSMLSRACPTEHMDADKARNLLLAAVDRILRV